MTITASVITEEPVLLRTNKKDTTKYEIVHTHDHAHNPSLVRRTSSAASFLAMTIIRNDERSKHHYTK